MQECAGILRVFFYFCIHGKEFRVVFSSAEVFRGFLFRGTAGIPSEIIICSDYSVFREIIFLSEIPNPNLGSGQLDWPSLTYTYIVCNPDLG